MNRKRQSLTLEKHNVTEVFISREYLDQLGIWEVVQAAAKADNFSEVYKILIADAKETNDTNLLKVVSGGHNINLSDNGITFIAD